MIHPRDSHHPRNVAEPSSNHVRNLEAAGGFNDVVQSMGSDISKAFRVGKRPNSKRVEHNNEDPALRSSTHTHP
jgi:hypothetical protein